MLLCWAWNKYFPKVSGWGVGVSGLEAFRFFPLAPAPNPNAQISLDLAIWSMPSGQSARISKEESGWGGWGRWGWNGTSLFAGPTLPERTRWQRLRSARSLCLAAAAGCLCVSLPGGGGGAWWAWPALSHSYWAFSGRWAGTGRSFG